jgi:glycosyltransferase involved in cell wall biosynthesis
MGTKISIVATSYSIQQLKDIQELLDSIKRQSYPDIEIMFIVERSPELYKILFEKENNFPGLKVIFNDTAPGMAASRNIGAKESTGELVAFVDDDAVLTTQWAEETANAYDNDSMIIGLTGPIVPLWEKPSMAWFPREFYWLFSCTYYDWIEPREVRNGYGTNISFRKEVFDKGLFFTTGLGSVGSKNGDEFKKQKTTAEETELSLRIRRITGKIIEYNPKIIVKHKVYKFRFTTKYIWKRAYIEGNSKMMIRKAFRVNENGEHSLKTEHELLQRIMFKLFPSILGGFFTKPMIAWRRLRVTVIALSAVACGYYSGLFNKIPGGETK